MFVTAYATLALAAVGSVSALVVPRKEPPKGWLANILEDYHVYHARYLALKCQDQHGKPFFDQCCHPLLKTQSLSSRPAQCTPSPSASASASAAEPTSTVSTPDDGEDDDCDDSTPASTNSAANPTSTSDDGEDDDDCDDSDDEPSNEPSTTEEGKTSTPHATKTQAATTEVPTTHAATTTQAATTTHKPSSTHSTAAPSKSASNDSGSSSTFTDGFATFFFQNGVAGACGKVHSDNDLIAAIDEQRYGNSGLKSSLCGKQVEITNPANGKSVVVTIVDDCPTCTNKNSIDLSVAAFKKIATEEEGMVKINWHFL